MLYDGTSMRLIGSAQGYAFAVNNAGQVTGNYYFDGSNPHAFVWAPSQTTPTDLGTVAGDPWSEGFSISDNGTIVGVSNRLGAQHAVMWQPQGSGYNSINLGTTGTFGPHTSSAGISNFGEIVGCVPADIGVLATCDKVDGPAVLAAVPASLVPIMVDLAALTAGTGCTVRGVGAINALGQFAGTGDCGSGLHALRLTPVPVNTPAYRRAKHCPTIADLMDAGEAMVASTAAAKTPRLAIVLRMIGAGLQIIVGANFIGQVIQNCFEPFDPNFQTVFAPQSYNPPSTQSDPCGPAGLFDEINQAFALGSQVFSYLQAMYATLNRDQSAFTMNDSGSFASQDQALSGFANNASSILLQYETVMHNAASDLRSSSCDAALTVGEVTAFINDVQANGTAAFPPDEIAILNSWGIDPGILVPTIVGTDATLVPLLLSDVLDHSAVTMGNLGRLLQP